MVKLNNTIDIVLDNLGTANKLADINEGDIKANQMAKGENLINARLNQEQAHTTKKQGKKADLAKTA